jgi:tryptophan synthase alpha chain
MTKAHLELSFKEKEQAGENLFVPYIMAGDGGLEILEERIQLLQDAGAAAIELGIPFSDPVADGPIIQEAGIRALEQGTTLARVLEVLQLTKEKRSIPIILMTYLNPVYKYGIEHFAVACEQSGVDGIIIPDLPMEEETPIASVLRDKSIAFIRLAALTSPKERLTELASRSEGFLYAVSVAGTTGERAAHQSEVKDYLQQLKSYSNVPVLAGFGVSNTEQAHELSSHCDGVIVGSKIVKLLHEGATDQVSALIKGSLKNQIHQ